MGKGSGPYEVEFDPESQLENVRKELLQSTNWTWRSIPAPQLISYGLSKDTYGVKYFPTSTTDMATIMGLIRTRHFKGGKLIFRIVSKRSSVNYPVVISAGGLLTDILSVYSGPVGCSCWHVICDRGSESQFWRR